MNALKEPQNSDNKKTPLFFVYKMIDEKDIIEFKCHICLKLFSYKSTLLRHLDEKHTPHEKIKCNICGIEQIPSRLKEHKYYCIRSFLNYQINKNVIGACSQNNFIFFNNNQNFNMIIDNKKGVRKIFEKIIIENENEISQNFDDCFAFINFKIGKGSFSQVHFGITKDLNEAIAVKIQKSNWKKEELLPEFEYLNKLQKYQFFPKIFKYVHNKKGNYIVEELYGPNLTSLYEFCDNSFDISTICNIGIDLISSINAIQDEGLFHMDIKKSNILWNFKNIQKELPDLCLIDYNLSRKSEDNIRTNNRGNMKYASLDILLGKKINKKDDLISIIYLLLEFFNKKLPWSNIKSQNRDEEKKMIINKKETFAFENFIVKGTEEIKEIYSLINKLKENEVPNYSKYQKLLLKIIEKNKKVKDEKFRFKWEKIIEKKFAESKILKNNTFLKNKIFNGLFKGYPEEYVRYYLSKYIK